MLYGAVVLSVNCPGLASLIMADYASVDSVGRMFDDAVSDGGLRIAGSELMTADVMGECL